MKFFKSKRTFLRVFSVFFAFFSWVYVLSSAEIQVEKSVKLNYILPDNMAISSQPVNDVHYTLSGPRAFIRSLLTRDDVINIDLRSRYRKKQKSYEVNMQSVNLELPFGVNSVDVDPRKILVELSPISTKEIRVTPIFVNDLSQDHKLISKNINPQRIKLQGPKELINNINEVRTDEIDLSNLSGEGEAEINLESFDPRITPSQLKVSFKYNIKPTRANMILRKVPIKTLSSRIVKNINKRHVTLMVLSDKGSEITLTPDDVSVVAEVPSKGQGVMEVPLKATLPEGVHLLEMNPSSVRVILE